MTRIDDRAERAYHVRRQRRSTITIIVVMLALAGAFYYASTYFQTSAPAPQPCTTVVPEVEPKPVDISVNVFNATTKKGLAATVAKTVGERGFKVKTVANDPLKKAIKAAGELRHGPDGLASAKVVAKHLPGVALVNDKREGDTVDLVLGNAFKQLGPVPAAATPTSTLRPCPTVTITQ